MTKKEITLLNLGESLDNLSNLDPRGYGVCKLLYKASRKFTGKPLCVNAALKLCENLGKNDFVFIMTGFVLAPFNKAETDGAIGSVFLARSLVNTLKIKPVVICPEDCVEAVKKLSALCGLNCCSDFEEFDKTDFSIYVIPFTKEECEAEKCAESILSMCIPKAVITVECPGKNQSGVYHNARGADVTALEAKQDILFEKLCEMGVLNISIGDLGNEIGLGAIGDYIEKNIPSVCGCGCENGIVAATKADNIITATTSDWGCYSLAAMLAFLAGNPDAFHNAELQSAAMKTAAESGLIDMSGEAIPAIDGFGLEINCAVVSLMEQLIRNTIKNENSCNYWFEKIIELKSFDE